jgi:hypothetical protein
MPAATPNSEAVSDRICVMTWTRVRQRWKSDGPAGRDGDGWRLTLALCCTESGTMGSMARWRSLSSAIAVLLREEWCGETVVVRCVAV